MTKIRRKILPRAALSAALVAGAGLAAPSVSAAETLSGAYLAARHAAVVNDAGAAADYYLRALALDSENEALSEQAVAALVAAGRADEAAPIAQILFEKDKGLRLPNLVLLTRALGAGKYADAKALMDEADDGAFNPLELNLLRAWTAVGLEDYAAADAALANLTQPALFKVFGSFHGGLILGARGQVDEAAKALADVAEAGFGSSARQRVALGSLYASAGRLDEARSVFETAAAEHPGDALLADGLARLNAGEPVAPLVADPVEGAAEALFGIAGVLARERGRDVALMYARLATTLAPNHAAASILIGDLLELQEQYALAVDAYGQVDSSSPHHMDAMISRADALRQLEQDAQAVDELRALVEGNPKSLKAQIALGDMLRRLERYDEAAPVYDVAIELMTEDDPRAWTLYYFRGIAHERIDDWDEAEADFLRALEYEPDQPLVLNYLGYSWVELGFNYDRAREMIEKAVELRPEDGFITDSLGWILYRQGDFEGAVPHLERAVELEPVDPTINDHFGDSLWMVGRKMEARFQWKRALSFEPPEDTAPRIRRKLLVGLDTVLEEEAEAEQPQTAETADDRPNGG